MRDLLSVLPCLRYYGAGKSYGRQTPSLLVTEATKETITDCEIVYNPALSCVKLLVGGKVIQRMGHLRAGEIRER